jgi:hypothetical protein
MLNSGLLGLSAILSGTPFGLAATRILFDMIGEQLHIGRGVFSLPHPLLLLALLPFTLILILPETCSPRARSPNQSGRSTASGLGIKGQRLPPTFW